MHIDMPTRNDIERLAALRDPLSVSVYLPTSTLPGDTELNRLKARALFDEAIATIRELTDKRTFWAIEDRIVSLVDDEEFWFDMGRSLAIFVTPTSSLEFRLPNELSEYVSVSDRFAITPLLRAVTFPQAAFVLAISQNDARLVEVSTDLPAQELSVPGLPSDAASVVGLRSIGGRSAYGRIQGDEGRKVRLTQYARAVDHALRPLLNGESLPLVLAATEPIGSVFANLSGYAHLASERIEGNPDKLTEAELADAARAILDRLYAAELEGLQGEFAAFRDRGRATTDLSDLANAAVMGAVATLAVDMDAEVDGTVDENGSLLLEEGSGHDAIEEIARLTIASGGRVLALRKADLPDGVQAAGILRYAV